MIAEIIKNEKTEIIKIILRKFVGLKLNQREIELTPDEVVSLDIEGIKDSIIIKTERLNEDGIDKDIEVGIIKELEELQAKKKLFDTYQEQILNVEKGKEAIEEHVEAYKILGESVKEITNLLK